MRWQPKLIEALLSVHLHVYLQILLHHVKLLPQGNEADAAVEVAVDRCVWLTHDLSPLVAAKKFNALEALLDHELPQDVDHAGHKNDKHVHLSLLAL